jgi:cytochrome c oxidase subunit 2
LLLPKDIFVRLLVTSDDVIHSLSLPSCGIKIDAVPGRLHEVSLFLTETQTIYGQCSELCGANHGFMPIEIVVLHPKYYFGFLYYK